MRNGGRVMREVARVVRTLSTDDVLQRMSSNDVPCMPVISLDDVASHPQVIASGSVEELDHDVLGRVVQPRPAARFLDLEEAPRFGARLAGQDTDDVLRAAGYADEEIQQLRHLGAAG